MPGCGGCSASRCRTPRWCSTGGMPRCVSNTRCRRQEVLARPIRTCPTWRFADWSGRNGACGTGVGRDAGANSRLCAARRSASIYICGVAGIRRLEHLVSELLGYLERNQGALVPYAVRRRQGEAISTAFVASSVNQIIAKRMNKKTTDALEQGDGAALPRRPDSRAEQYAGRLLPSSLSRLPSGKRQQANLIRSVINPTDLHAPLSSGRLVTRTALCGRQCNAGRTSLLAQRAMTNQNRQREGARQPSDQAQHDHSCALCPPQGPWATTSGPGRPDAVSGHPQGAHPLLSAQRNAKRASVPRTRVGRRWRGHEMRCGCWDALAERPSAGLDGRRGPRETLQRETLDTRQDTHFSFQHLAV